MVGVGKSLVEIGGVAEGRRGKKANKPGALGLLEEERSETKDV